MYWIAISPRLSRGKSTPAMRAISRAPPARALALALLVARILADDPHHACAAHHLAVLAPHLDRHMGQHLVAVFQLDPEHRVRERLNHRSLDLDRVFLCHAMAPAAVGSGSRGRSR